MRLVRAVVPYGDKRAQPCKISPGGIMRVTVVPTSNLLTFLVSHDWRMDLLPETLRPFTERQLRRAWSRVRVYVPTTATTTDHVMVALLIARGM